MAINRDKVEAAAIKLLQQGKYDKAIAELKKLVEDDRTDVRTLLKLGEAYVKTGNTKESIDAYERAAGIYTEQGFYLKAVAVFKQILRVDANVPELHLKLAELYQQLGLTSDALQHYHNVATFYESHGRARDALEMLKRMVDLDPDNLASRIKLGELFAQQGLVAQATQELRNALVFLKSQQRFDDFVRVGEKLVVYDASALDIARDLANIYMQRGQPSVALSKLQICFKAEPRNVEVLGLIAQAFLAMQQVPKTISVFKEMAKIYASDGKADLAQRTWQRVIELSPGDSEAEQALGKYLQPESDATVVRAATPPRAGSSAGAPRANSGNEKLQRLLTETDVYVKYGLKEKAVEHLQKIFALRPDHIPALDKARTLLTLIGSADLTETVRRLVKAADEQGHARADEWRAELARLDPPKSPAADLLEDDDVVNPRGAALIDEDFLEPSSSMMINLAGAESVVMEIDRSQFEEASAEGLPPDETGQEALGATAPPTSSLTDGTEDDIDQLAREALSDTHGGDGASLALPSLRDAGLNDIHSFAHELSSSSLRRSEQAAEDATTTIAAPAQMEATGPPYEAPEIGHVPVPAARALVAHANEAFDPSSFDLPTDVKEVLRASANDKGSQPSPSDLAGQAVAPGQGVVHDAPAVVAEARSLRDDPAEQFFSSELEEADFFIQQDLLEEAKEILQSILEDVSDSRRVQWMLARIAAKETGDPEPRAPWEVELQEQILEQVTAHAVVEHTPKADGQVSVDQVLSAFKKGVAELIPEEDAATHYDLGIAYREMGLQDDAISEFRIAGRAQSRAVDARYVIGLVKIEQGKHHDAVQAFDEALLIATATRSQRGAVQYGKACALEQLGSLAEALRSFKAAKLLANGAADIDRRIEALIDKVGDVDVGTAGANDTP